MIWCVDDDHAIRDIEIYTLESTGYKARGFADGAEMFEALKTEKPELIVLDIMLPEEDGVEILRKLRKNEATKDIPVIMATAKGSEIDKIQSLDLGADDYLVKPFGVMEMVSRIKAVLRRCQSAPANEDTLISLNGIVINDSEHTVSVDSSPVTLTLKEYELLKLMLSHPGKVYSREQLLAHIWGTDYMGETRTVDMHIKNLRQKLGEKSSMIKTVIGIGYRLEVQHV